MTTPHAQEIAQALVDWFTTYGRDYPWRRTTDPWAILVSEIMLQQTTIPTVLGRYDAWMQQFPTPADLAAATEEEALRSWEGLGYYRRVRALQAAARAIMEQHSGHFPADEASIRDLFSSDEVRSAIENSSFSPLSSASMAVFSAKRNPLILYFFILSPYSSSGVTIGRLILK